MHVSRVISSIIVALSPSLQLLRATYENYSAAWVCFMSSLVSVGYVQLTFAMWKCSYDGQPDSAAKVLILSRQWNNPSSSVCSDGCSHRLK
jgi:hypothetical protein